MRVCFRYGFTFLCMPKCASTSIEKALEPYSQLSTNSHTGLKHTNYRKYRKYIQPFINQGGIEVVCLMREPISWLHSWYRFRTREAIANPQHRNHNSYCGHITFQKWVEEYLSETPLKYAKVGIQKSFLVNSKAEIGVDKIFKYENLEGIVNYFEKKIGKKLSIPTMNTSPEISYILDKDTEKRLKEFLKDDYEIYNSLT